MNVQTTLVVSANLITTVISMALMLIVFWQAPRRRTNQLFALMMLILSIHSALGIFFRFADDLDLNVNIITQIVTLLMLWFIVLMLFFADEYAELESRWMKGIGVALMVFFPALIMSGLSYDGPFPSETDPGGYYVEYTLLGILGMVAGLTYLAATFLRLRGIPDPRTQAVYPACGAILLGLIMLALRPFSGGLEKPYSYLLTFPYSAVSQSIAALIMGRALLNTQLFDPLRELNEDLRLANIELEQANQMKSQFLATMSHELRTPLNAIIGYTDLLIQGAYGDLNEKQTDRMEKVVRNSQHLLGLINDVLDLSKIEAGRVELVYEEVELDLLVNGVVDVLAPLAREKGLDLAAESPSLKLQGDHGRLRQVLINLVGNAIKFTHEGSVQINVNSDNGYTNIAIKDTGIGIPKEMHATIFEEFRQVDSGVTRQYQGTGLGLAITRRLIEMHKGTITVASEPGQGSTFLIRLPVERGA